MLRTRVLTAAVLLGVFLAALFLLPKPAWIAFCAVLLGVAVWEWGALAALAAISRTLYAALVTGLFMLPELLEVSWVDGLYAPALIYYVAALFWLILVPLWIWRQPRLGNRALVAVGLYALAWAYLGRPGMPGGARVAFAWILPVLLGLAVVGMIGDLFESLIKRQAGVKDSGTLLPEIGRAS